MIERDDRVNWSSLKAMLQSPKHYRHGLTHQREDTDALRLGRLTHCAIYEPRELAERYAMEPRFHGGMNDETARDKGYAGGKQSKAAWAAENVSREIVTADQSDAAQSMASALHSDLIAGPMIVGGFSEQLVTWTDPLTGIECRGRVDHVNGCLSDLKTSRSVEPRWFAANAVRLGYHGQLAYYADGLEANGIALDEPPALIVVENVQPHDVIVFTVPDAVLAAGRKLYRSCLDRLAWCRENDSWPGVADMRRQELVLPAWAMPETEELTLGGVAVFD